jgi:hypothetical protein
MPGLALMKVFLQALTLKLPLAAAHRTLFPAAVHISFYLLLSVSRLKDTKYFEPHLRSFLSPLAQSRAGRLGEEKRGFIQLIFLSFIIFTQL